MTLIVKAQGKLTLYNVYGMSMTGFCRSYSLPPAFHISASLPFVLISIGTMALRLLMSLGKHGGAAAWDVDEKSIGREITMIRSLGSSSV
jgi:hypothetical protein